MLKLTAVAAVLTFASTLSSAQARSDHEHSDPQAPPRSASHVSKTVIEELPSKARSSRTDSTPINLKPADWPRISLPGAYLLDQQSVAAIPTWPTYYDTVQAGKARFAASYETEVGASATDAPNLDTPVIWGPDVVPSVEVVPAKPKHLEK